MWRIPVADRLKFLIQGELIGADEEEGRGVDYRSLKNEVDQALSEPLKFIQEKIQYLGSWLKYDQSAHFAQVLVNYYLSDEEAAVLIETALATIGKTRADLQRAVNRFAVS